MNVSKIVKDMSNADFETMFAKKGRGRIIVTVLLKDSSGNVCAEGLFEWFVQRRDD